MGTTHDDLLGRPAVTVTMEPVLVEFGCSHCDTSMYRNLMAFGSEDYPDLDKLASLILKPNERTHIGGVFENEEHRKNDLPSGFARCGEWKIIRLWKMWENPIRYQEEDIKQ